MGRQQTVRIVLQQAAPVAPAAFANPTGGVPLMSADPARRSRF